MVRSMADRIPQSRFKLYPGEGHLSIVVNRSGECLGDWLGQHVTTSSTVRALLGVLTILHLGPGAAFVLLAVGCETPAPAIGAVCTMGAFASFALLTAGGWVIFGSGFAAMWVVDVARKAGLASARPRIHALLAVLANGALAGAAGTWLTGNPSWWLAIPVALAVAWLFLANPLACEPLR